MKTLVSAIALLVGSKIAAMAATQTRKFMKSIVLGASLAAALASTAFAKEWKAVAIAMDGAYAPWNFTDSSGQIVGFEPDLAMDLCKRAGFECKIISQDWDGMIPGLKAGKFDVIMDGMSITEERKKEIDFSKPYAAPPVTFVAAKHSPVAKALGPAEVVDATKDPAAGDAAIKAVQAATKGMTIGVQS
jgi:octopine/nopaline transport system substrate-binding protein